MIVYRVTVTNSGNVTLSGVGVGGCRGRRRARSSVLPRSTLRAGGDDGCSAIRTVTQGDLDAGEVVNVASGSGLRPRNVWWGL